MTHSTSSLVISSADILLAQQGDNAAFERVIAQSSSVVHSIALAATRDLDVADDVSQQVFIRVWKELNKLKNPQSFLPWIRQITRNFAINSRRGHYHTKTDRGVAAEQALQVIACPDLSADELRQRSEQQLIIGELLANLAPSQREIVLLFYREDQSVKQVAQLLDIEEAAVRKRLERLRTQLKQQILSRYSDIALATLPVGIASFVISAAGSSAPATASTLFGVTSAAGAASKGLLVSKMAAFMYAGLAAVIGIAVGLGAQFFGMQKTIKRESIENNKTQLTRTRNWGMAWTFATLLLFYLSYVLSDGAILPIITYSLFAVGLLLSTLRAWKYSTLMKIPRQRRYGIMALSCGLIFGFGGLYFGLITAGRLSAFW